MILLLLFILLVLFGIAGSLSAFMDSIETPVALSKSRWWNRVDVGKADTWMWKYVDRNENKGERYIFSFNKYVKLSYSPISDPWHRAKTAMIVTICASVGITFYFAASYEGSFDLPIAGACFGFAGIGWNVGFIVCYDNWFKRKV